MGSFFMNDLPFDLCANSKLGLTHFSGWFKTVFGDRAGWGRLLKCPLSLSFLRGGIRVTIYIVTDWGGAVDLNAHLPLLYIITAVPGLAQPVKCKFHRVFGLVVPFVPVAVPKQLFID